MIEALARDIQSPGETSAQAYTRAIERTEPGKALLKAMRDAPDVAPGGAEKYKLLREIQARADERFPELNTPQKRFAHAIDVDAHRRPYDNVCKALYEASKAAPGRDVAPREPEPPVDFAKAEGSRRGSASEEMLQLAREHQ